MSAFSTTAACWSRRSPPPSAPTRPCKRSTSESRIMLDVRNVHSFYGAAHVLHGVSLDVKAGEIVALLGRNGMGKTTLIRSIMGLASPAVREGSILLEGRELRGLSPHEIARRKVGYVPQ